MSNDTSPRASTTKGAAPNAAQIAEAVATGMFAAVDKKISDTVTERTVVVNGEPIVMTLTRGTNRV